MPCDFTASTLNLADVRDLVSVSDTAYHKGEEFDVAGPHLCSLIEAHDAYSLGPRAIVPDDADKIRGQVTRWTYWEGQDHVDWIIVTGGESGCPDDVEGIRVSWLTVRSLGTGWGERDVTPQVRHFHG